MVQLALINHYMCLKKRNVQDFFFCLLKILILPTRTDSLINSARFSR